MWLSASHNCIAEKHTKCRPISEQGHGRYVITRNQHLMVDERENQHTQRSCWWTMIRHRRRGDGWRGHRWFKFWGENTRWVQYLIWKKVNYYLERMVDSKGRLAVWSPHTVLSALHQKYERKGNSKQSANLTDDNEGSWWYQRSRMWTLIVDMNDGRKEWSVSPSPTGQFSLVHYFLLFGTEAIYQGTLFIFFWSRCGDNAQLGFNIPNTLMSIQKDNPAQRKLTEYVHTNIRHKGSVRRS